MIKAIIFDLNGVFLRGDLLTVRLQSQFGIPEEESVAILNKSLRMFTDKNAGSVYSLWEGVFKKYNVKISESEFLDWWFREELIDEKLVEFAESLKSKGAKVFLLSNNFRESSLYYRENFTRLFSLFDKTYFSWETGLMKPDKTAFRNVLNCESLEATETIFVDDSEKNVNAAIEIGIKGIVYTNYEAFINTIEPLLIP